jgi:hypothetical protein
MWDAHYPLGVRLLSLFHIGMPLALLWGLRRVGYDRRGFATQSGIAAGLLVVSRFLPAALNLNYAYQDPLLHRTWGPAPAHLALTFIMLVAVLYWPTHLILKRFFRAPRAE